MLRETDTHRYIVSPRFMSPGTFANLHAQPHENTGSDTCTWMCLSSILLQFSLIGLVIQFIFTGAGRRLILSSVKHCKKPTWKACTDLQHHEQKPQGCIWMVQGKNHGKMINTKTVLFYSQTYSAEAKVSTGTSWPARDLLWEREQFSWNYLIFSSTNLFSNHQLHIFSEIVNFKTK